MIEGAGVQMTVEHFELEDPAVRRIAKAGHARLRPLAVCRIGGPEDCGRARHVPRGPFAGRRHEQVIVERHERAKRRDVGVAEPRLAHRRERHAVLRPQNSGPRPARDRRQAAHVERRRRIGVAAEHGHAAVPEIARHRPPIPAVDLRRRVHRFPRAPAGLPAPDLRAQVQVLDAERHLHGPGIHGCRVHRWKQLEQRQDVA